MKIILSLSLIAALTLTGCVTSNKSKSDKSADADRVIQENVPDQKADQETYQAHGKTYYVEEPSKSFKQRGQASWYGHAFHGRKTASGEIFNMHQMTAAHSTLSFPAYMRVTNLDNGKSIIVRVNDRLPKHKTRIIDLSYGAAKKLDMYRAGIANVEIERVHLVEKQTDL
jgi:rare lipoprotein A